MAWLNVCSFCFYLFLISGALQAQNLEGLSKQKPVLLSGGITARTIFYDANGIAKQAATIFLHIYRQPYYQHI